MLNIHLVVTTDINRFIHHKQQTTATTLHHHQWWPIKNVYTLWSGVVFWDWIQRLCCTNSPSWFYSMSMVVTYRVSRCMWESKQNKQENNRECVSNTAITDKQHNNINFYAQPDRISGLKRYSCRSVGRLDRFFPFLFYTALFDVYLLVWCRCMVCLIHPTRWSIISLRVWNSITSSFGCCR